MKKVLFHKTKKGTEFIGLIDKFDPSDYNLNVLYQFEQQPLLLQTIQNLKQDPDYLIDPFEFLITNNIDLEQYAKNWNAETQNKLSKEFLRLGIDFDVKDLGLAIVIDANDASKCCYVDELTANNGAFEIDTVYNTYNWTEANVNKLSFQELKVIFTTADNSYPIEELMKISGVHSYNIAHCKALDNIDDKISLIKNNYPLDVMKKIYFSN